MTLGGLEIDLCDFCRRGDGIGIRWIFKASPGHLQILRPAWVVLTRCFLALDSETMEAET